MHKQIRLPHEPGSARLARARLAAELRGLPPERMDDALLLVSELVGNAVRHGEGDVEVTIDHSPPRLRVSVSDEGDGVPTMLTPSPDAERGRGLALVNALASTWGVDLTDGHTCVWFEV